MAIRPVDLQGAFVGAQQNAGLIKAAEDAPATAQAANNAAFAAQVQAREETIEQTAHAAGNKVRPRGDSEREAAQHEQYEDAHEHRPGEEFVDSGSHPLGLAGEGQHFIDVTA